MKKVVVLFLVVCTLIMSVSMLSACSSGTCHNCGDPVGSDPVKAGGRTYCSYDCYMDEALFG